MAEEPKLVLLGEGVADEKFFEKLIKERKLPAFLVEHVRGRERFQARLEALVPGTDFGLERISGVLVVADNDDEPQTRFNYVRSQLANVAWCEVPDRPRQIVRKENSPAVAILMLPWDETPGALETLCLESMYEHYPEKAACLHAFFDCAAIHQWAPSKQHKMRMQALLCTTCESDPNTPISHAFSRDPVLIHLNHTSFDRVAAYVHEFAEEVAGV